MPRVTSKGQVTIPKAVRDAIGIEPGDEVTFEATEEGYTIRKEAPTTMDGEDPFEVYRGAAGDASMAARLRRLRGDYPRTGGEADPGEDAG